MLRAHPRDPPAQPAHRARVDRGLRRPPHVARAAGRRHRARPLRRRHAQRRDLAERVRVNQSTLIVPGSTSASRAISASGSGPRRVPAGGTAPDRQLELTRCPPGAELLCRRSAGVFFAAGQPDITARARSSAPSRFSPRQGWRPPRPAPDAWARSERTCRGRRSPPPEQDAC